MKNISIKNNELDNITFNDYKLSILITQDGLSYSLYSIVENKYQNLVARKCNELKEIEDLIKGEGLNTKDFANVNIVVATSNVTIVPEAIFCERDLEKIYRLNFFLEEDQDILYSKLNKSSSVLIFSVDKKMQNILNLLFKSYSIFPQSASLIESKYIKNKISEDREKTKMFVQVFENFIDVLILKDSRILFYNTFTIKTNNDLLYYIMNIFEQLKLSQNGTEVIFSGFIETDNLAILNLKKFIKIVYFESQDINYKYYYKFQEIAPHYFVNFLSVI